MQPLERQTVQKATGNKQGFIQGLALTLLLAGVAYGLAQLPYLSILGQLVIAIILGMAWKTAFGVPHRLTEGIGFSSKKLLRFGIILLGTRLNLMDIVNAGPRVFILAAGSLLFGLIVVYSCCRIFKVNQKMSILTACGSSICGAAAVVAIAPQVKASNDQTAMGAAVVAILGTIFTLAYTVMYPLFGLLPASFGAFSGATLHEIAHVIAAAEPVGHESLDMALIVKLTRVALLIPVAIILGIWTQRSERRLQAQSGAGQQAGRPRMSLKTLPIPWFILGFLAMSGINTLGVFSAGVASMIILLAYLLIAMAMAGLGLNVDIATFKEHGHKTLAAGFIGSVLLSGFGYLLTHWLNI